MKINGLVCCVDYWQWLTPNLGRWFEGLDSLTIVTSTEQTLPELQGITLVRTDLFYKDGAVFNKGRAMEYARRIMPWTDWILFFDADVIPEKGWKAKIEAQNPQPGSLYGCWRLDARCVSDVDNPGLQRFPTDAPGVGYFQLFHSTDPVVNGPLPLIATNFVHGGNYDNIFMDRWRNSARPIRSLDLRLVHVGERDNWFGIGHREMFAAMQKARSRGQNWRNEVISKKQPVD